MRRSMKSYILSTVSALLLAVPVSGGLLSQNAYAAARLCLYSHNNYCATGNGAGNQVTIVTSNANTWTALSGGGGTTMYQNGSGHCLKAESSINKVTVSSGACSSSNDYERWVVAS